jgi:hypothetical protein
MQSKNIFPNCQAKTYNGKQCPREGYFNGYCVIHWRVFLRRKRQGLNNKKFNK